MNTQFRSFKNLIQPISNGYRPVTDWLNELSTTPSESARRITPQGIEANDQLPAKLRQLQVDDFLPLEDTGLAHEHVRIKDTRFLLRIPKQSQMRLNALSNLYYQASCFHRMQASGHTPECYGVVPPCNELAMGCLIVEFIEGRPLVLPNEVNKIALCLAAIHQLPVVDESQRTPLISHADSMQATFDEVQIQSAFLDSAQCSERSKHAIQQHLQIMKSYLQHRTGMPPTSLISFDAHPGNFIVDNDGKAILVDLEKARYAGAGFDLAHATLYTSTTWDINTHCVLTEIEIQKFNETWHNNLPSPLAADLSPHILPMRYLMWLWSLTWCAKWTTESQGSRKIEADRLESTEDWSAEKSDTQLIRHVTERVDHYLDIDTIERVGAEFANLH